MAHSPIFRPESFDPDKSGSALTGNDSPPGTPSLLARLRRILNANGGGPVSAELALDLVLHEFVELARTSTGAQAAAIALRRGGEMVCRATTGDGAPGLGVRLSGDMGLSAACVQTGNGQRCDDTENDARADVELCRRLGVRSILVTPLVRWGELLGVVEVFSGHAAAFGDGEMRTLQMLSRSIVESVEIARGGIMASAVQGRENEKVDPVTVDPAIEEIPVLSGGGTADFLTGALMLAVIALAVTLGWMIGRGQQGVRNSAVKRNAPALPTELAVRVETLPPAVTVEAPQSKPGGELTVYRDGKLVFPGAAPTSNRQATGTTAAVKVERIAGAKNLHEAGPAEAPAEVTAGYVIRRVEPEYPEHARERRVQGAVVLDAVVGVNGEVEKFNAIRGDPDLAAAASAAVRQWRFKALERDGEKTAFQTQITVVFRLP